MARGDEAGGSGQAERGPGVRGHRLQRDGGPRPRPLRRLGMMGSSVSTAYRI